MRIFTLLILFLFPAVVLAQDESYLEKVRTLDSTIETLYSVISGEKGEARDWKLFEYLFIPEARLIPSGRNKEGEVVHQVLTPRKYIDLAGNMLVEQGFFEKEISRETDRFGNIVQLFSTYESYRSEADTAPFARGINSIQLLYDGERWWILSIFWQPETDEFPIPEEYLDQ